jgi:hypothetical protein
VTWLVIGLVQFGLGLLSGLMFARVRTNKVVLLERRIEALQRAVDRAHMLAIARAAPRFVDPYRSAADRSWERDPSEDDAAAAHGNSWRVDCPFFKGCDDAGGCGGPCPRKPG